MTAKKQQTDRLMTRAGQASLTVAVSLIVLKGLTFFMTGSVAILSSLFDSVQDLMTSGVNMVAIKHAVEPADKEHRFGHGKAQALGSLIQSFIIAVSALFLLYEAVERFYHPQPIAHIGMGVMITLIAIVMTIVLVRFQDYVIDRTNSLSIRADRAHYVGDILMNVGVIVAMCASYFMGWVQLDAIFGIGVALYLFFAVYQVVREAFSMLMDTELPGSVRRRVKEIAYSFAEVTGVYGMKTRKSGSQDFVQFCIQLRETMTLKEAHDITDRIERRIKKVFPEMEIIIHPEPERKKK